MGLPSLPTAFISLNSVAHAAAASAAWLEDQAHLVPSNGNSSGGGSSSSSSSCSSSAGTAGGGDAEAGGGDSSSRGGDGKAGGAGTKCATWANELEASRGELADGPEHEGLPCHASGYCSAGKLGPAYVGEVDSTEGYRKALAASCYRKECIHTTIGSRRHLLGLNLGARELRKRCAMLQLHCMAPHCMLAQLPGACGVHALTLALPAPRACTPHSLKRLAPGPGQPDDSRL